MKPMLAVTGMLLLGLAVKKTLVNAPPRKASPGYSVRMKITFDKGPRKRAK